MDYKNESDDDFDYSNGYNDNYANSNGSNGNSSYNSQGNPRSGNPNGLSKAELRKTNKPIMEKRRRARINHCLNELKSLILEAMKKDPARHTKLEKADILEMTVKHLQSVQRQQLNMAIQTDPSVIHKFKTGFMECAEEVNRYVSQLEGIDASTRQRLSNHLNNCATSLEQIGAMTNFNNGYRHGQLSNVLTAGSGGVGVGGPATLPGSAAAGLLPTPTIFPTLTQDLNNNNHNQNGSSNHRLNPTGGAIQMNGVQLIPSRLPSGELALIVPNAQTANAAANLLNNSNINNLNMSSFSAWPPAVAAAAATTAPPAIPSNVPLLEHHTTSLPLINNFATQLQRISAFSKPNAAPLLPSLLNVQAMKPKLPILPTTIVATKPKFHTTTAAAFHQSLPQNYTTTTSPPLSPISSVSSLSAGAGDDSSSAMHTSSDLMATRAPTPPHDTPTDTTIPANPLHNFTGAFATPPLSTESSLCLSSTSTASSSSLPLSQIGAKHLQQQQVTSTSGGTDSTKVSQRKRSLEISECADSSDGSMDAEPAAKRLSASSASVVLSDVEDDLHSKSATEHTSSGECQKQFMQDERDSMWRPW